MRSACHKQDSPVFMLLGGGLAPTVHSKGVFSPPSENAKGYPIFRTFWGQTTTRHTYTYMHTRTQSQDRSIEFGLHGFIHLNLNARMCVYHVCGCMHVCLCVCTTHFCVSLCQCVCVIVCVCVSLFLCGCVLKVKCCY